jgi:hypothetical protein
MPRFFSAMALLLSSLWPGTAPARDLEIEIDMQHVAGALDAAELEAMLADARLAVEAFYQPVRLIEGVTARRERTMPIGSRLFAIPQTLELTGAQVERRGRTVRVTVPDVPPGHDLYRLNSLTLLLPVPAGPGRSAGQSRIPVYDERPADGAWEAARVVRYGALEFGMRLRHRWSGAKGAMQPVKVECHPDYRPLGEGQYRFRPGHRYAAFFTVLASTAQSDPPSRPPAGQRSLRMREPYPEPIAGWNASRNHLVELQVGGQAVERYSIYAEQPGAGSCRRTRSYDALFAGGRLVAARRSWSEYDCGGEGSRSESVEAAWLEDGSLARYIGGSLPVGDSWDGFAAERGCPSAAAPPPAEVEALTAELLRLRGAFFR